MNTWIVAIDEETRGLLHLGISKMLKDNPDTKKPSYNTVIKKALREFLK